MLGDSLSAGYNMPAEKSWPVLMASGIKKKTDLKAVINASISGDTTGNGLNRLPGN